MTTNPDTRFIREYLSENPSHLRAALAVHDAWRLVKADVCERFLEHLRRKVENRLRKEPFGAEADLRVRCRYGGDKKYSNALWITRGAWVRNEDTPLNDGRNAIKLHSGGPGPNRWYWGVSSPKPKSKMTEPEKERRAELVASLRRHELSLAHVEEDWWLSWEWLPGYADWDPLVPELHEECEAGASLGRLRAKHREKVEDAAQAAMPRVLKRFRIS